ncbi:MAG TPA: DUF58 domain-containing protein [Albitalea sp.]
MTTSPDLLPPSLLDRLGGLELIARTVVRGFVAGLHRAPFRGAGLDFAGHRAYQQGDDLRHVDWRLFGRTDRYYVREFREDANLRAWLIVDATASMGYAEPGGIAKLRYASIVAAALAHIMLGTGDAVGLATFGERVKLEAVPRSRRGHLHDLLVALERLRAGGRAGAADALDRAADALPRRGRIVLLSDLLEHDGGDRLVAAAARIRVRGDELIALRVLSPTEAGLRPAPAAAWYDPESPDHAVPAELVADTAFAARVRDYYDALARRLRSHGAEYVALSTDEPVENALRRWLAARRSP